MRAPKATAEGALAIRNAAAQLFAEQGFDSASVAQIAERAGVSKSTVFHHYASKQALFMAVMREASGEHTQRAKALSQEPGSCAEKLRRLVAFEFENMFRNEQSTRLILRELIDSASSGDGRDLALQVFRKNFSEVVALLREGQASGEFHGDFDPAAAALSFHGALSLYFQCGESLRRSGESAPAASGPDFIERVCDLLLSGVRRA